jgi:hypothetical protein
MKFKSEPFGGQKQEPVTEPSQPKATSALRDYYEELLREEHGPFGKPIYPNPLAGVPKKSGSEWVPTTAFLFCQRSQEPTCTRL